MEKFSKRETKIQKNRLKLFFLLLPIFIITGYIAETEILFIYYDNYCSDKTTFNIWINEERHHFYALLDNEVIPDDLAENYIMIFPASKIKVIKAASSDDTISLICTNKNFKIINYSITNDDESEAVNGNYLRSYNLSIVHGDYDFYNKYYRFHSKLWGQKFIFLF